MLKNMQRKLLNEVKREPNMMPKNSHLHAPLSCLTCFYKNDHIFKNIEVIGTKMGPNCRGLNGLTFIRCNMVCKMSLNGQ